MRTGLIAQEDGHDPRLHEDGRMCRSLFSRSTDVSRCQRTQDKDGYTAVQFGAVAAKAKTPRADARPFRQSEGGAEAQAGRVPGHDDDACSMSVPISASTFVAGQMWMSPDIDR